MDTHTNIYIYILNIDIYLEAHFNISKIYVFFSNVHEYHFDSIYIQPPR